MSTQTLAIILLRLLGLLLSVVGVVLTGITFFATAPKRVEFENGYLQSSTAPGMLDFPITLAITGVLILIFSRFLGTLLAKRL